MAFFVYILHSKSCNKFYVGSTADIKKRLFEHNNSPFNTFTSKHRPWKMVASFEAGKTRGEAEKIEKFIKKQKSTQLIKKLIDPEFVPNGKLAQLVRVPHLRD